MSRAGILRAARVPARYARDAVEVVRANVHVALASPQARALLRPDFLGIGAQKSATTWLDAVLRLHPGLGLPARRKEVHYFDSGHWKGPNWYRWHFRGLGDRVRGEITPAYSILPPARIREAHALNPALKIVLLLRDPVDRAWSMATMDLFRDHPGALSDADVERAAAHIRTAKSVDRSRYTRILDNWTSVFGAGNVFVGYYEEVAERPAELLARLFAFLGVDDAGFDWQAPLLTRRVHSFHREIPERIRRELQATYEGEIVALHERLGNQYTARWLASCRRRDDIAAEPAAGEGSR